MGMRILRYGRKRSFNKKTTLNEYKLDLPTETVDIYGYDKACETKIKRRAKQMTSNVCLRKRQTITTENFCLFNK